MPACPRADFHVGFAHSRPRSRAPHPSAARSGIEWGLWHRTSATGRHTHTHCTQTRRDSETYRRAGSRSSTTQFVQRSFKYKCDKPRRKRQPEAEMLFRTQAFAAQSFSKAAMPCASVCRLKRGVSSSRPTKNLGKNHQSLSRSFDHQLCSRSTVAVLWALV